MEEKKKIFTSAPLPFMGQKRRFLKHVNNILEKCPQNACFVDLFGGSGLLSHYIKANLPNSIVVYNDFDNYRKRLENIPQTNRLIAQIRDILIGYPKDKKIDGEHKSKIIDCLKRELENNGYIDFITVSSNIMFAMKYAFSIEELQKETLYNCVRVNDYSAEGYLEGVIVESADYRLIFEKYKDMENVVFLVDPPYLSTEVGTYKSYWKLRDYLDVLNVLDGTDYIYFTSNKSQIIELCEWMESKSAIYNPFAGAITTTLQANVNYQASYTDIMISKVNYELK